MTKSIERVEQDLTQLRQASSQLGKELSATYDSYFASLAPTLKQQAVQACFYLCTTCYPEAFLKLSYDRRSQLLATLQRVIGNVIASLAKRIDPNAAQNNDDEDEVTGELTSIPVMPIDWFATPASLATWQQNIEDEIINTISEISYKANLLLQQVQIIPHSIPKPILEAHPEVERQGGNTTNVPNILSIHVDREERGKRQIEERELVTGPLESPHSDRVVEELSIVQINSVFLRLSEVEFSDMTVLNLRKDIDRAANKINNLQREYVQKQQELKIAEAESAWRNSWFEN